MKFYEGFCHVFVNDKEGNLIKKYVINHGSAEDRKRMRFIVHTSLLKGYSILSVPF